MNVLISCETGGEAVPAQFSTQGPTAAASETTTPTKAAPLALLPGHLPKTLSRDAAADYVARRMAEQLRAPLICNRHSQDLIDVTRSLHHRWLFPPLTRAWDADNRKRLIDAIYQPYRRQLKEID